MHLFGASRVEMNNINIEPTKFTNVRTGAETFGFRSWDDYGQTYGNTLSSIPDDDLEFLELILTESDDVTLWGLMEHCEENQKTLYIGGLPYPWADIEKVMKKVRSK